MRLSLICFTGAGAKLGARLLKELKRNGHECRGFVLEKFLNPFHETNGLEPLKSSLQEWTGNQFETREGLIFIGAAGIAVRAIAPWVKDKRTDPAVVVIDDSGRFSISLLSGHLGGANGLAEETAKLTGGIPVITTATDIHGRFAVDNFAKEQGLWISDMKTAKAVSADVLAGEPVGFFSDFPAAGRVPEGFTQKESCKRNVWITVKRYPENHDSLCGRAPARESGGPDSFSKLYLPEGGEVLRLVPRIVILGIGCKRGTEKERIEASVEEALRRWNIEPESAAAVATIDIKKEEAGLLSYVREHGLSFQTYPAERLLQAEGEFSPSSFVKEITGVDNVCERAAVSLVEDLGGGRLMMRKQAGGGVTVAAAVRDWKVKL
ncbi:cobalt-precorrin 5A hydrolase [Hungatella sp. L12]|uniref:Cobalt-precorrin 5A hydrolase n=2 Tax=Hungatella hominis TaxID=2763050 RepID=A0ABR7H152_9FIRM|nr:cobalt-precorrin 5A hydrolase [Hungatella hominis]MBC5706892.1 cobalt-precorrin 5A hydrolase [Hungatella hominis]